MSVTYNGTLVRNFIYNDTNVGQSTTLYTQSELDSISSAVASKGSTATSNTPSDIISAIENIQTGADFSFINNFTNTSTGNFSGAEFYKSDIDGFVVICGYLPRYVYIEVDIVNKTIKYYTGNALSNKDKSRIYATCYYSSYWIKFYKASNFPNSEFGTFVVAENNYGTNIVNNGIYLNNNMQYVTVQSANSNSSTDPMFSERFTNVSAGTIVSVFSNTNRPNIFTNGYTFASGSSETHARLIDGYCRNIIGFKYA